MDPRLSARQNDILARIGARGAQQIDQLAQDYGLTTQSIRRDINALCALGLTASHAWSQPPAPGKPPMSRGKEIIESGPKKVVAESAPAPREVAENPTVEPGKVKWHKSFADARAAAKESGKPVLHFQLMGRLDQRFT